MIELRFSGYRIKWQLGGLEQVLDTQWMGPVWAAHYRRTSAAVQPLLPLPDSAFSFTLMFGCPVNVCGEGPAAKQKRTHNQAGVHQCSHTHLLLRLAGCFRVKKKSKKNKAHGVCFFNLNGAPCCEYDAGENQNLLCSIFTTVMQSTAHNLKFIFSNLHFENCLWAECIKSIQFRKDHYVIFNNVCERKPCFLAVSSTKLWNLLFFLSTEIISFNNLHVPWMPPWKKICWLEINGLLYSATTSIPKWLILKCWKTFF